MWCGLYRILTKKYVYAFVIFSGSFAGDLQAKDTHVGLGLGARQSQSEYLGVEEEVSAIPIVLFENNSIEFTGDKLSVKVGYLLGGKLSVQSEFDFGDAYSESDSYIFEGMGKRKGSVWLGTKLSWKTFLFDSSIDIVGDASGNSHGQKARLSLAKKVYLSRRLNFKPSVEAIWYSDDYVDYYYGVNSSEILSFRPQYTGESSTVFGYGLNITYVLTRHEFVSLTFKREALADEINNSPLVDDDEKKSLVLYYLYMF